VLRQQVDRAVLLEIVLQQELLILILNEVLWVVLPGD
jgi:hypothetical protein